MKKDRIESAISFFEPRGNSVQNGNVQIAYFLRPFKEKNHLAQWRTKGRIEFKISVLEPGEILYKMSINPIILLHKLKLRISWRTDDPKKNGEHL